MVQRVHPDAVMPKYAHEGDAGVDLYSVEEAVLAPGERKLVPTGLKISFPRGFEAQVRPKSGLALKQGLSVLNTPGTVDAGYRGEVGVIVVNLGQEAVTIAKKTKIAQMIFTRVEEAVFEETVALDTTTRGEGGFGSTGTTHA